MGLISFAAVILIIQAFRFGRTQWVKYGVDKDPVGPRNWIEQWLREKKLNYTIAMESERATYRYDIQLSSTWTISYIHLNCETNAYELETPLPPVIKPVFDEQIEDYIRLFNQFPHGAFLKYDPHTQNIHLHKNFSDDGMIKLSWKDYQNNLSAYFHLVNETHDHLIKIIGGGSVPQILLRKKYGFTDFEKN